MARNKYNRTAKDGASENAVTAQCELLLCNADVCQPQHVVKWPLALQNRMRGFYLKTQLKKRADVDRKTFARTQTQSRGIPDLLVRLHHWPVGVWLGCELKNRRGTGAPTAEQRALFDRGAIVLIDDAGALWRRVMELDAQIRGSHGQGKGSGIEAVPIEPPCGDGDAKQSGCGGPVDRTFGHRENPADS